MLGAATTEMPLSGSACPSSSGFPGTAEQVARLIAVYLPQFHPIPENDEWWGEGFTEWTNVGRAKPLFPGHHQPHLPADLGYYDLRVPEVREKQARLACQYGIHGFCYYHYWFGGRRLLERPFTEVLESRKPDFPFCLCWANENWTRAWDGMDREILVGQDYSPADDLAHIRSLLPAFADPRYIRIDGRPLFLVYSASRLPSALATTDCWRREAERAGLGGLFLVRVESVHEWPVGDPRPLGFDAALRFQPSHAIMKQMFGPDAEDPHRGKVGRLTEDGRLASPEQVAGNLEDVVYRIGRRLRRAVVDRILPSMRREDEVAAGGHALLDYAEFAWRSLNHPASPYPFIPSVFPAWDNSARKKQNAVIFQGSTPDLYKAWLIRTIQTAGAATFTARSGEPPVVFVNAWNEWAEGNHLEPDQRWGRAYLEATRDALIAAAAESGLGR